MSNAVFTASVGSIYDDLPEFRYHFPQTYLNQVKAAVGDWIVYYEPRRSLRGGRQAYFAMARVLRVESDPRSPEHHYAYLDGYQEFDRAVGFQGHGTYWESALQKSDGSTSKGAFGRAVRTLPASEFEAIVREGFHRQLAPWEAKDAALAQGIPEEAVTWDARPLVAQCITRPFRDEAFRRKVREAYRETCAFSGLRLINGGGRPEVQAAHIRPVASDGPDSVRNGLALTGTLHWLFDRGLLTIEDDLRILVSPRGLPDDLGRLLRPDRLLMPPEHPDHRPHPVFLAWHREHVFKT
ncbi:HNH endonuclease [Mesoterricola sediminis]|uniref:Restriction endonuclease n=1 Tax=Mesoterricola sediminis TaxID=2927980 RepID=A0AA48GUQ2_9BACT|nr:HNH endonuclease [Mesoterricola sediminis]BDU75985.1 restriction endonuclease [Mesoterricola sediminis]